MNAIEILFDASIKALLVFAVAGVVNLVSLRRSSAARRHLVWSAAAVGALSMPLLSLVLPGWQVLPAWASLTRDRPAEERVVESTRTPAAPEAELPTSPPFEPVAFGGTESGQPPRVSPEASSPSSPRTLSANREGLALVRYLFSAWVLVAAAVLAPVLLGLWSLRRLERGARRLERGRLAGDAAVLAKELGLKRAPRLLESRERPMPMHWGILRPRLLLPAGASEWPRARLRLVLLHELAHARRRDCLTQLLVELSCALYWFNPLAWLARAQMREEREVACDDLVLRSGLAASDYAEELLRVATGHRTPLFAGRAAIAMARPSTLERRLRAILDARRDRRVAGRVMLAVAAVACALVLPPLAMVRAGEEESAPVAERTSADVEAPESPASIEARRLEAIVSHPGGHAPESCGITVWVGRRSDAEVRAPWVEDPPTGWHDSTTGLLWEPLQHVAIVDRASIEVPGPGTYRITVHAGHGEPTQVGDSGPIEIDRSSPTAVVVPIVLEDGPRHVFQLIEELPVQSAHQPEPEEGFPVQPGLVVEVDCEPNRPRLENAELFVVRSDGLPLASWRRGWSIAPQGPVHTFERLAPGEYTVYARVRAYRFGLPEYELAGGARAVRITPRGGDRTYLPMRRVELDEEALAERWPWSLRGTVTDTEGKPLEGVAVSVHCGIGTLRLTGEARTDDEGNYAVRFGPGMRTLDEKTGEWVAPLQAATVSPAKEGWYERDLYRGGKLWMAQERPEAGRAGGFDPQRVVLPGEPRRLDFVMRPAAWFAGQLLDEQGAPIAGGELSLAGAELWPSSSVLHTVTTDETGDFRIGPVPIGVEIWFEQGRRKSARFGVIAPGERRVRVKQVEDGGLDAAYVATIKGERVSGDYAKSPLPAGSGRVIDGETEEPVVDFSVQFGRPDPRRPGETLWTGPRGLEPPWLELGEFQVKADAVIDGVVRLRVTACGYVPSVIEQAAPNGMLSKPLVVHLKHSEWVQGRVLDHTGRPLAKVKLYAFRGKRIDVVNGEVERSAGVHRITDAAGRFLFADEGAERADALVAVSPDLNVFLLPLPLEGHVEETVFNVRLPQPATLILRYDIPGDLDEAEVRAQLATWEMPEWHGKVECTQWATVEQGGTVVLSNLVPGSYDLSRDKKLRTSPELGRTAMCDRRTVTLGPGERKVVEFVRERGARASGHVLELAKWKGYSAIVYIRAAEATGDPIGGDRKRTTFDGQICDSEGRFQTALLEPGEYQAVAHVYAPLTEEQRHSTGWIVPHLIGTAHFVVPPEGDPEPIEIGIVKFTPR